ncbi:MAG TPA: hypothetical protein VEB22_14100 [Phycisphaerales bacterium]|nr:hypothetical protein [Phycisphaerales bacterium]
MRRAFFAVALLPALPGCVAYEIRDELRASNASFRELARSREELESSNRQLAQVNRELAEVNKRLAESSSRLVEVEKRLTVIDRNLGYISSAVDTADRALPFVKVPPTASEALPPRQ